MLTVCIVSLKSTVGDVHCVVGFIYRVLVEY